jgi:hypothetical protein
MSARIEAWLYATGSTDLDATASLTVTEPGPTSYTARLAAPALLSTALTQWTALLNAGASGLAGTYSLTWDSSAQAVTISASGVASFAVEFVGNLHQALGFSSATGHTGALTYTGDQQALARFDDLRWSSGGLLPHEDRAAISEYRHGRVRAIAWAQVDTAEGRLHVQGSRIDALLASYCSAGRVRVYQDESNANAYSVAEPGGYLDGYVLALDDVEYPQARSAWASARLLIGVGR